LQIWYACMTRPIGWTAWEGKGPISLNYFPEIAETKLINVSSPFFDGLDRLFRTPKSTHPRDHQAGLVTIRVRNSVFLLKDPQPRSIGETYLFTNDGLVRKEAQIIVPSLDLPHLVKSPMRKAHFLWGEIPCISSWFIYHPIPLYVLKAESLIRSLCPHP